MMKIILVSSLLLLVLPLAYGAKVYLLPQVASPFPNLFVTGILTVNGSQVCTPANGLCASAPGAGDGNNYTMSVSTDGTTTRRLNFSRYGMDNLTVSWTDWDTDTNDTVLVTAHTTSINALHTNKAQIGSSSACGGTDKVVSIALNNASVPTVSCATDQTGAGGAITSWVNTSTTNQTLPSPGGVTFVNITGLSWTRTTNKRYFYDCIIIYSTNVTTSGIGFATAAPLAVTNHYSGSIAGLTAATGAPVSGKNGAVAGPSTGVTAANTAYSATYRGIIAGGTGGPTNIMFRGELAALYATVQPNSTCIVQEYT